MKEQHAINFIREFSIASSYHSIVPGSKAGFGDFYVQYVNEAFEKLFQIKNDDMAGVKFSKIDYIPEKIKKKWVKICNQVIRQQTAMEDNWFDMYSDNYIRIWIVPLDNTHFWMTFSVVDEDYFKNIHWDDFFDVNLEMMCIMGLDGKFHKVNRKFEKTLGYSQGDFNGKNMKDFLFEKDIDKTMRVMETMEKSGNEAVSFENRYCDKKGNFHIIEWRGQRHGKFLYCAGRDITENRKIHLEIAEKNRKLIELTSQLKEANDKLENMASMDHLTGLYNRAYFDKKIVQEMERADLTNEPLSMFIYDIDRFKRINDEFGHPIGDEVLVLYSSIFKKYIRREEFACRMGGEEFALVMPNTSLQDAERIAERIRKAFDDVSHPVAGKVTASFGVAQRLYGEDFLKWYRRIDKALYIAKDKGRNQVVVYQKGSVPTVPMNVEWNDSWSCGNTVIDTQHRELLKTAMQIHRDLYSHVPFNDVLDQVGRLKELIRIHFEEEITIVKAAGYEKWQEHQSIHSELLEKFDLLEDDFVNGRCKAATFFTFILHEILSEHFVSSDMDFFPLFSDEKNDGERE